METNPSNIRICPTDIRICPTDIRFAALWYYAVGVDTDVKYGCLGMLDWLVSRVTRCFCEKIAQKVAQPCFCWTYYIKLFYGVSV